MHGTAISSQDYSLTIGEIARETGFKLPINKRASEMWKHIVGGYSFNYGLVEFRGKRVLDLGSGYCDLAIMFALSGADVTAVEQSAEIVDDVKEKISRLSGYGNLDNLRQLNMKINDYIDLERAAVFSDLDYSTRSGSKYDIIVCTSVLPYLDDRDEVLRFMNKSGALSIIECQYAGDGPGLSDIRGDTDMAFYLGSFWKTVYKVGETDVVIRDAKRSIWFCS